MQGIVTDIQRFSLKDGPGIRTTVFLKGCNMVCAWCHNPETLSPKPQLLVYPEHCIGCGACIAVCPSGAWTQGEGGKPSFDRQSCTSCGACAGNCFTGALVMSGKEMSVGEVLDEAMQDRDYYIDSGGGITLSGGEVSSQPRFTGELLRAFRQEGVSTAIETNLLAPWEVYESWMQDLDLFMFDIKLMDPQLHKKWTGVDNASILENARRVATCGKEYIVRTPIIPGVNDTAEAIGAIAGFIKSLGGASAYELLLFNPLGEGKYSALGMENKFDGTRPSKNELAEMLREAAESSGVPVTIN